MSKPYTLLLTSENLNNDNVQNNIKNSLKNTGKIYIKQEGIDTILLLKQIKRVRNIETDGKVIDWIKEYFGDDYYYDINVKKENIDYITKIDDVKNDMREILEESNGRIRTHINKFIDTFMCNNVQNMKEDDSVYKDIKDDIFSILYKIDLIGKINNGEHRTHITMESVNIDYEEFMDLYVQYINEKTNKKIDILSKIFMTTICRSMVNNFYIIKKIGNQNSEIINQNNEMIEDIKIENNSHELIKMDINCEQVLRKISELTKPKEQNTQEKHKYIKKIKKLLKRYKPVRRAWTN